MMQKSHEGKIPVPCDSAPKRNTVKHASQRFHCFREVPSPPGRGRRWPIGRMRGYSCIVILSNLSWSSLKTGHLPWAGLSLPRLGEISGAIRLAVLTVLILFGSATPVEAAMPQSSGQLPNDVIDRVGEQVMQGNDFRSVRRRVLEQMPETDVDKGFLEGALGWMGDRIGDVFGAIRDFFTWLFSGLRSPSSGGTGAPAPATSSSGSGAGLEMSNLITMLAIAAILVILITIAAMIVKSADARKRRDRNLLGDGQDILTDVLVPPGELAASTYESRAIQLASGGNYRAAIRELLLGSMSWIERAGIIRYRRGLTNRDYVRAVWRRQDKREAYLTTAVNFEYVFFGRRVPTVEMFESCLTSFRGAFREEETPTAAV